MGPATRFSDNSRMPDTAAAGSMACTDAPLSTLDVDLIVVPWFEGQPPGTVAGLDEATGGEVGRALVSNEFGGRLFDLFVTTVTDPGWKARRVALVGAGAVTGFETDVARRIAAVAG